MDEVVRRDSFAARSAWLAKPIGLYGDAIRLIERLYGPIADLLTRCVLAQAFFVSGVLKLADWQTALNLARYEYPVSWMDPVTAAHIGVAIEVLCPILLALGLATRLAAVSTGGTAPQGIELWLPLNALEPLAGGMGLLAAILLAIGLATRLAALGLILLVIGVAMLDAVQMANSHWLVMALAPLALYGAGPYSLDQVIDRWLRRAFPQLEGKPAFSLDGLPRVVIVGAGFAGVACAKALRRARVAITLVDRHNYHLFPPLLYQVATASLDPGDIAMSTRSLFREQFNTRVLLGEVTGIDTARQQVAIGEGGEVRLPYDYLVLATGARHSYFGRDEWEPFAPGLKQIEDATEVRRRVLLAFERAEGADDPQEREAWLTFLIVGGGPTGVELAGAIAELARFGMDKDYRQFDPAHARVILVQSAPRILPTFAEGLSSRAQVSLERLGVEVLIGSRVEHIDAEGVLISGQRTAARTVLWAAGVVASPAAKWINGEADKAGRVKVNADLLVPALPNVFAVGDTALANAWNDQPVPGLGPAAKQAGQYVARVIQARITARQAPRPFRYKHLGSLATIGRKAAVADFGWVRVSGALAWWLWGFVHVYFLAGMRNRVSIVFDWLWAYLTFRSGTRLITGGVREASRVAVIPVKSPLPPPFVKGGDAVIGGDPVNRRPAERVTRGEADQEQDQPALAPAERVCHGWQTLDLQAEQDSKAPQGDPGLLAEQGLRSAEESPQVAGGLYPSEVQHG